MAPVMTNERLEHHKQKEKYHEQRTNSVGQAIKGCISEDSHGIYIYIYIYK